LGPPRHPGQGQTHGLGLQLALELAVQLRRQAGELLIENLGTATHLARMHNARLDDARTAEAVDLAMRLQQAIPKAST